MWKRLLPLLFLGNFNLNAQTNLNYSIGFVGENFNNTTNAFSGTFILENDKCIVISNGLGKYNYSSLGKFENKCILDYSYNSNSLIELNVFPNPTSDYVIIKTNTQSLKNDKFNILTYNISGQQLDQRKVESSSLKDGLKLSLKYLSAGWYTIVVTNEKYSQNFKVLKL